MVNKSSSLPLVRYIYIESFILSVYFISYSYLVFGKLKSVANIKDCDNNIAALKQSQKHS